MFNKGRPVLARGRAFYLDIVVINCLSFLKNLNESYTTHGQGHLAQPLPVDTHIEKMSNDPVLAKPARPVNNPKPAREETAQDELQPGLIDFSVYKCLKCDKMVMGYEKGNHLQEVHKGKSAEWKKIR
jgi:hypothetical protein